MIINRDAFQSSSGRAPKMDNFKSYLQKYAQLEAGDWNIISAAFEKRYIKKNEVLLEEGNVCRHLYFLEDGLLRYYIYKDGTDITKFFTDAPYCFTSQLSFTSQKPSTENIQAIEDSTLWQISLEKANDLLELRSWNTFVRRLIQEVQQYTEQILQEMQTETAEERYENMLRNEPDLIQRIPLKYLATYFGIAPQSLSRIRKNVFLKSRS